MKKILILLLLSTIYLFGCSYSKGDGSKNIMGLLYNIYKGSEPIPNMTNVSGILTDTAGAVIPSATLELSNQPMSALKLFAQIFGSIKATSDVTNAAGEFLVALDVGITYYAVIIDSKGVNQGGFTMTAISPNNIIIANYTGNARVNQILASPVSLVKCDSDSASVTTKKLRGRVFNAATTSAVSGAIITTSPVTSTILSESDGTFTIAGIAADTASMLLNVSAPNYEPKSENVNLTCQNSSTIVLISPVKGSAESIVTPTGTTTGTDASNSNHWGLGIWDTMVWQ